LSLIQNGNPRASTEGKLLSAVLEIANIINSELDLDKILSSISSQLYHLFDYDVSCVAIYERDENCLYIRHVFRKNGDKTGEGRYVPLDKSNLVGWVAINGRPVLRNNIPADKRFKEIMKEDNLKSDMVVPLYAKDALIGTVNVGSYELDHFDKFDLDLLVRLSKLTSIAIENSQVLKELRELGEKYRVLMKNASDMIVLINTSGQIVECNDILYRITGYSPSEVLGKEFYVFTIPERRSEAKDRFYKTLSGRTDQVVELPYLKKNGDIIYLEVKANVIKIKRNPYILVIARDVTERRRLQQRITIQNRELKEINQKLIEIDELKNEFLSRISHELRTPLSIIMAYTSTLIEDMINPSLDSPSRKEFLEIIQQQSNKLLGLIDDLLDLSKVEISETMLNISEGSINEVIRISISSVSGFAESKNIKIVAELDENIPIINFDAMRMRQVIVNLLENAIKYSPDGEVVKISSKQSQREVIISVEDRGPGIKKKDIPKIFDKFTQIEGINTREFEGMGIGLKLVKHYVELHGGKIWVESELGVGSTFFVSIPIVSRKIE